MKIACPFICLCLVAIAQAAAPPAPWSVSQSSRGHREIRIPVGGEQGRALRYDLDSGQLVGVDMGKGVSREWRPTPGAERLRSVQWAQGYPVIHQRAGGSMLTDCVQFTATGWVRAIRISAGEEPLLVTVAEPSSSVAIRGESAHWRSGGVGWIAEWASAHPCRWLGWSALALELPPRREAIDITITVTAGDSRPVPVPHALPTQWIEAEASAAGVQLRFADSLATQVAADRDQWRIADVFHVAKRPAVTTVNIGTDDRSVLLGLTGAAPGSVLAIGYRLKTVEGVPFEGEILVRTED